MAGNELEAINALTKPAEPVVETPPAPEPTPEPEPAGDDAQEMTYEEYEAEVEAEVEKRIAARLGKSASTEPDEDPDFEDAPAWAKKLNKRLDDVTNFTTQQTQSAMAERESRVQAEIDACAGKFKMTQPEVDAVAHYLLATPGKAATTRFEEAAVELLPHIKARGPKPAPAPATPGGKGAAPTNPIANGGTSGAIPKEYVPPKGATPEAVLEQMRADGSLNLLVK